jgi:hypothetical protein
MRARLSADRQEDGWAGWMRSASDSRHAEPPEDVRRVEDRQADDNRANDPAGHPENRERAGKGEDRWIVPEGKGSPASAQGSAARTRDDSAGRQATHRGRHTR